MANPRMIPMKRVMPWGALFLAVALLWVATLVVAVGIPSASVFAALLPSVVAVSAALVYERKLKTHFTLDVVNFNLATRLVTWIGWLVLLFAALNAMFYGVLRLFQLNLTSITVMSLVITLVIFAINFSLAWAKPRARRFCRALFSTIGIIGFLIVFVPLVVTQYIN